MLVRTLNDGVKGGSVKFSYDPVTQKVCVHMKGDTTFMLYGDLPDILGFGRGAGVVIRTSNRRTLTKGDSIIDLRRVSNRYTSIRASSNHASSATRLHHCYE